MRFGLVLAGIAALSLAPSFVQAADASALTDAQKAAVEDVVRNLLQNKEPEIVMNAVKTLQDRLEKVASQKSGEEIKQNKDKIYKDATSPVGGNPKGDVTVVEFFDYQCHYCKSAAPIVAKLLSDDKNVRLVYKEYPILGEGSVVASRAALASVKQGKYEIFHNALMNSPERFDESVVLRIAKDAGLDVEKLRKDMADASISKILQNNIQLGNRIGARGTPSFVIADTVYPGALSFDVLKERVGGARKEAHAK